MSNDLAMKPINAGLHHGHSRPILGCNKCYSIARGWACLCGCPNSSGESECRSCGVERRMVGRRCKDEDCGHALAKHGAGGCESSGCPCGQFRLEKVNGKKGVKGKGM